MKRNILLLAGCLLLHTALFAQKNYSVDPFEEITVAGNMEVVLEPGDTEQVVVYLEGIPEDQITVKVSQGILRLGSLNSFLYKDGIIKVYVTYKKLRVVKANAGAIINSSAEISASDFLVKAGSGSQIELLVAVNALDATASEGGRLTLRGKAESQNSLATTGGQYSASDLLSQRAYIRANTGGRAEVSATEVLDVSVSTGGEVIYYGEPEKKYVKSLLGGEVRQRSN